MAYRRSMPLVRWLSDRRRAIETLATAHANMAEVEGPGRPLEIGRPIAHAYILRVVAEFQGFARDLHDLSAEKVGELSGASREYRPMLTTAATEGRYMDRGNADLRSLKQDFQRLGISGLGERIGARNGYWKRAGNRRGDSASYQDLIELRNCLAHGNSTQLEALRERGVPDTVTWARQRLPGLDRTARALDRLVWDHLRTSFKVDPW